MSERSSHVVSMRLRLFDNIILTQQCLFLLCYGLFALELLGNQRLGPCRFKGEDYIVKF